MAMQQHSFVVYIKNYFVSLNNFISTEGMTIFVNRLNKKQLRFYRPFYNYIWYKVELFFKLRDNIYNEIFGQGLQRYPFLSLFYKKDRSEKPNSPPKILFKIAYNAAI